MTNTSIPHGYHICFTPRGRKVYSPLEQQLDPEASILAAEQSYLTQLAMAEETDPVRQAIRLILTAGHTMAEACRSAEIKQYRLTRAIKRIAKRVQQG